MLICPICNNSYSKIDVQHLKKHGISKDEYFKTYGAQAPFGYSNELKSKKSGENHPRAGKSVSDEVKQKISAGMARMWSEDRASEKQKTSIGAFSKNNAGENHFNRGRFFKMSDEQKAQISKAVKLHYKNNPKRYSISQMQKWNSQTKYKIAKTRSFNTINKYLSNLSEWADNIIVDDNRVTCECGTCGRQLSVQYQTVRKHQFSNTLCHTCFPILNGSSNMEDELVLAMSNIDQTLIIRRHDRTILPGNLELDVYLPDFNIAIEFNGLYWHSDLAGYDNNKHQLKMQMCNDRKIQLIHIFENEWVLKRDIVLSRLRNLIKKSDMIFARNCSITQIPNHDAVEFLNANHIQGGINCSVNLGLIFNKELIAVMTFSKARFNKNAEWELVRYASKLNVGVVGGAGKLLSYFERNKKPESLISYADLRWSKGGLYNKLNFIRLEDSKPGYFYFKKSLILENRVKFQKHKLHKLLEHFDSELSEWENMKNNGYNRIWDCGNAVFMKKYS